MAPLWIALFLLFLLLLIYLVTLRQTSPPPSSPPPTSPLAPWPELEEALRRQTGWPYPPRNPADNWQTDSELQREIGERRARIRARKGIPREECPNYDPVLQQNNSPPKGVYIPRFIIDLPCFQQAASASASPAFTTLATSSVFSAPIPALTSPSFEVENTIHHLLTFRPLILPILLAIDASQLDGLRVLQLCVELSAIMANLLPSLRFLAPFFAHNLELLRGRLEIPAEHLYVLFLWLREPGPLPGEITGLLEQIEEVLVLLGGNLDGGRTGAGEKEVAAAAGQLVGEPVVEEEEEAGAVVPGPSKPTAGDMLGEKGAKKQVNAEGSDKKGKKSKKELKKADTRFEVPKYGEEDEGFF